jgi:hypothetical protein
MHRVKETVGVPSLYQGRRCATEYCSVLLGCPTLPKTSSSGIRNPSPISVRYAVKACLARLRSGRGWIGAASIVPCVWVMRMKLYC